MAWPEDELPLRLPATRPMYAAGTTSGIKPALAKDTSF